MVRMSLKSPFLGLLAGFAALFAGPLAGAGWARGADLNPGGFAGFDGGGAGIPVLTFLKLPSSARGIGMGATSLTTDEEATAVQGNPALLAMVQDYYYSVSHAEILGEFRHENLAFTWPTIEYGSFGGSARILAATAFEDARDIDEVKTAPSAYDIALGFSYGKSLWDDRLHAGGRLDLIRSDLDGDAANGYALSGGVMFMMIRDLRLAFTLNNLSHGIRYDASSHSPVEPLPLSVGMELGKPLLDSRWSGQLGFSHGNDGLAHYYAGAEWRMIKYLVVRAGYEGSSQDRELGTWAGMAAGLGIKYDRITLDYGYKALGPLGDYHAFTLNYSRKSKFRPRDEVLLEQAMEKYGRGKYAGALSLARAAIAVNPYNFKAQALAQKLQLELDRQDEMAVTLAYTANTDGKLASEWREGRPIGGLPRRKTKLLQMKGAAGKILILDAGDLTSPGSGMEKKKYVYGAYAQMPYDAVNMGKAELELGADQRDLRLPLMGSQIPLSQSHGGLLTEKVLTLRHGAEVLVLGAIDPVSARSEALGGKELERVADAVRRRAGGPKDGRILVLMLHGNLAGAYQLAGQVPDLDVILLSGEAQALGSPMKAGKTLICSPGRGGTHVGELTLLLKRDGRLRSFRHFLLPLDATVPEDAELKKFLEPVMVDPNAFSLNGYDEDYRAQVMAYIRAPEPAAGGKLILKDLRTGGEYPLETPGLLCCRPILAYGKNRVAFEGEDESGAREIYAFEPGVGRLDTLTALGGRGGDMRWILRNNALLAVYEKGGKSDLYRIDPWSREVRNLTKGRFGDIRGFDVDKKGERLVLNADDGFASTLWFTNPEMAAPVSIASDKGFLGSPRWSPDGEKVAFLVANDGEDATAEKATGGKAPIGELRIFDFPSKALIKGTQLSRARSFSWSADGKRIFYAAGVNLGDVNAFHLDSLIQGKVTAAQASPRDEANPVPKVLGDRDGILFEASVEGSRKIIWMDLRTREEKVLADSAAYNSLK
ncbi:MAG TPA: PorV/PorQ family protein [Fibrobacteria bacterium]|nr:PorV/PorQ family protein [Fibrobacteria bacterium]